MIYNKLCDDPVLINAFFTRANENTSETTGAIIASFPLVEPLIPHMSSLSFR